MKNNETIIISNPWYYKEPFNTLFSVLGLFIPTPSQYRPTTPLGFKIGKQWFGFIFSIGIIPIGWIMILVAIIF